MPVTVSEATAFAEAATPAAGPGRLLVRLISAGQGSSGYYTPETLKAAVEARVFAKGTHMYIDHASETEDYERPEGTLLKLAAVLVEDARWDEANQAIVAEVRVYSQWRQMLAEMAEDIGVSIRAMAESAMQDIDGTPTKVITALTHAISVDFVTHAGRGGRIEEVLESARNKAVEARNVGQWVESHIHRDFTVLADEMFGDGRLTREERITLSAAIGDALAAFVGRLEADAPELYARDLWEEPVQAPTPAVEGESPVEPDAEPASESGVVTENVPVIPAGQSTTQSSEEDTMPQIEEARLRQLEEAHGRVPALESERDTAVARAEEAERRAAVAEATTYARDFARTRVTAANADLPSEVVDRIVGESTREIPLTDELRLDTETLGGRVDKSREAEETYLARISEASGIGSVRGVGPTQTEQPVSEADADKVIASAFGRTPKGA